MSSDQIANFALCISLFSLLVSLFNLVRDRHVIKAHGSVFERHDKKGVYCLSISVSNSGKRPVSISFVLVRKKGVPGNFFDFTSGGKTPIEVDVGQCATMVLRGPVHNRDWNSGKEIREYKIYVVDALGKKHRVNI